MKNGIIYLIRRGNSDAYKIGFTKSIVEKRLKSLQTACDEKLEVVAEFESEYATTIERSLHNRFSLYSVEGEWFHFPDDLQLKIKDVFLSTCRHLDSNIDYLVKNNTYIQDRSS